MKLLCFGDSNTYGYDPSSFLGDRYTSQYRWTDIVGRKQNWEVINLGENGREIPRREEEWTRFNQMLLKHKPIDLLMIMLGTNDLLQGNSEEEVARRMKSFLGHIDLEKTKILLIGPPRLQLGQWVATKNLIAASLKLNKAYEALSKRIGVGFADARSWDIPMTFDGVHFTEEGHKAFAERLINHFNKGE